MHTSEKDNSKDQLSTIKNALLSLKATGPDGFEGLMRVVLTSMTGIPFRLAASGLQGGMDGDAARPSDFVSFETKRYSGDIHRNDVITKIADIARTNNSADRLWVLRATSEISAQLTASIRQDGDSGNISTLILDWTDFPLPILAVAMAAASAPTIDFLVQNCWLKEGPASFQVEDGHDRKHRRCNNHQPFGDSCCHMEYFNCQ